MEIGDICQRDDESPVKDIAYLTRSEHRVPALVALTVRPRSRSELCESTGVSSSTIRRTIGQFEERNWVRRVGYQYEATRLGEVVASAMENLIAQIETERKLRDIWDWLPEEMTEFTVELWSDMTVTVAEPDSPYRPINRFESLLRGASELRYVGPQVALMEPCLDALHRLLGRGVDVTLIDRPGSHAYFRSTYPQQSSEMMNRDNFTVLEHDELLPYGIGLLDDQVVISCYEEASGTVHGLIDTDVPAVREWAESVYDSYRSDAGPLERQPLLE